MLGAQVGMACRATRFDVCRAGAGKISQTLASARQV